MKDFDTIRDLITNFAGVDLKDKERQVLVQASLAAINILERVVVDINKIANRD